MFEGTSLLAGAAGSASVLIVARAAEGLSVAFMVPAALSILMATFPDGADRNRALGIWGSGEHSVDWVRPQGSGSAGRHLRRSDVYFLGPDGHYL